VRALFETTRGGFGAARWPGARVGVSPDPLRLGVGPGRPSTSRGVAKSKRVGDRDPPRPLPIRLPPARAPQWNPAAPILTWNLEASLSFFLIFGLCPATDYGLRTSFRSKGTLGFSTPATVVMGELTTVIMS
jgi:hypothetical protein